MSLFSNRLLPARRRGGVARHRAASLIGIALLLLVVAAPAPVMAQNAEGQLLGEPPPEGGIALMTWTGGTIEQLLGAAPDAVSIWITHEGVFYGYVVGAPDFVNERFHSLYSDNYVIPQGLLVSRVVQPERPAPVNCRQVRCVALTFDDGPSRYTPQIIETLRAHNAGATFFVEGIEVEQRPQHVAAIASAGFEIGNHTYSHLDLTTLTTDQMRWELNRTADLIEDAAGVRPAMMRPPFGSYDSRVRGLGLPIILWSVDPKDYLLRDPDTIVARVSESVHEGAVILLHETQAATVEALPRILAMLESRGLVPVSVSDLFGGSLEAGSVYTSVGGVYAAR